MLETYIQIKWNITGYMITSNYGGNRDFIAFLSFTSCCKPSILKLDLDNTVIEGHSVKVVLFR